MVETIVAWPTYGGADLPFLVSTSTLSLTCQGRESSFGGRGSCGEEAKRGPMEGDEVRAVTG